MRVIGPTSLRPTGGTARAVRAVLVGVVVAACATAAHALAGGVVGAEHVAATAGAAALVAAALAGRRLTGGQLLGLLLLGQAALHLTAAGPDHGGAAMLPAHLVATVLSLVLVRQGEDAWWRLADVVLARIPRAVVVAPPRSTGLAAVAVEVLHAHAAVLSVGGRAPPVRP